jgi:hypothetical protein
MVGSSVQDYGTGKVKLGFKKSLSIVLPYLARKIVEQIKSLSFIIIYLVLFQILILNLPVVYSFMIAAGVALVIGGLTFFMEGLELGLMPFGEIIGSVLPRKSKLPVIMIFSVLLGIVATLAEPAIFVLKAAGSGVKPDEAPLLYSLLNDFSNQLIICVGFGVGLAVLLGVLRFLYGWSLKVLIIPLVLILISLTIWSHFNEALVSIMGLAWDCGAVTTGPVTVPLVLALGIGVCRIVSGGKSEGGGFGIVTLASLFPIIAVFLLGIFHYQKDDFYGRPNYKGKKIVSKSNIKKEVLNSKIAGEFTLQEWETFQKTGDFPGPSFVVGYDGGERVLKNGKIYHKNPTIIYGKQNQDNVNLKSLKHWDPKMVILEKVKEGAMTSIQAIIPLCLFLYFILRLVLREKIPKADEILIGIIFSVFGMWIFVLGIELGLTPLGGQLGSNIPGAFTTITPWGLEGYKVSLLDQFYGKIFAAIFAFFLGFGATLAEPALHALGATVEKITIGAFKKSVLMKTVAGGVGLGIAMGVSKISYNIPLEYLILPPYALLIILTIFSSEDFVNFGWDSAGVTTGPITVPLVLAMGLGVGSNVPGVSDGFGVLAMASVMPIISVLVVGLIVSRPKKKRKENL